MKAKNLISRCAGAFLIIAVIAISAGCVSIVRYDGPYRGKIIDAETKKPIEGVVVVGVWNVLHPNIAGANYTFYDATEAVTGSDGEFYIKGKGLRVFSNLEEMSIQIFKAGYEQLRFAPWVSLHEITRKNISWQGDKVIIFLKKLSPEERKEQDVPSEIDIAPKDKQKQLLHEINKELEYRGFAPYRGY